MSLFFTNLKRNLKAAFVTVKTGFGQYVCLLAALIVVEMLFGTLTAAVCNNRRVEKQLILDDGYDYHCAFVGIDDRDRNVLSNIYAYHVSQKSLTFSYRMGDSECRVVFTDDFKNTMSIFDNALLEINAGYEHVSLVKTPLYQYEISGGSTAGTLIPLILLLMVLSFFLLMALFRIRINHFKFTYSIYLTYGGDFKRLLSSVFYETLLLVILAFVPAVILTYAAVALLYLPFGMPFGFSFLPIPLMFFCTLICAGAALVLPIRILASTVPVKLMKAQDNSNLVSSPRRSSDFLKKSLFYTEWKASVRFRKNTLTLLLSTVTFAAVFLVGCYLADVYTVRTDTNGADITVNLDSEDEYVSFTQFFRLQADGNDVKYTLEKRATDPFSNDLQNEEILPHLVLEKSKGTLGYYSECAGNTDYLATEALDIRAYDEDAAAAFSSVYGYEYTGEPEKLLSDGNYVIVSSSLANNKVNSLVPGDTVWLPVDYVPIPGAPHIDPSLRDTDTRLQNDLFMYREFTVAAVVTNYSDYAHMLLYLPTVHGEGETSTYGAVMGCEPSYTQINIYTEGERDEEISAMIVQDYLSDYGGIRYERGNSSLDERIREGKNYRGLIILLSILVLAVSPLAGIFSQVLFYDKRSLEFDVLRAVGAVKKDFVKIFTVDGLVISVLSCLSYAGLSILAVRLFCTFLNSPYAFAFFEDGTRASTFYPTIPLLPFFGGLALTFVSAVVGVLLPALLYKRSVSDHIAGNFTQTDEM